MDELFGQLASKAGVGRTLAEKSIGTMLDFLGNEGPSMQIDAPIDEISGAKAPIPAENSGGRLITDIQGIAHELFKFGRDKIGADQMRAILAETPGLSQLA